MEEHAQPSITTPLPPPPPAPFAPPGAAVDRGWLRDLATRQRMAIIAGILNALGGIVAYSHVLADGTTLLFELAVGTFVIVAAYRLARKLHGVGSAVLCGIAMLVPIVWIVVLVVLSSKASKQLRAAGIHVGFFGADSSSI